MARPYRRSRKHYTKKPHSTKKRKFGRCSYHLCDKNRVELYRCKHCREYFCNEHIHAKIPQSAPFKSIDVERHIEWEKKGGHPCLPYFEYITKKEKKPTPIIIPKISKPEPIVAHKLEPKPVIEEKSLETTKEEEIDKKIDEKLSYPKRFETPSIEPKKPEKSKRSSGYYFYQLKRWFLRKKHPRSRLRLEDFGVHLTVLICASILFWMIYSNIEILNDLIFLIFKLGSLVLLIIFFVIVWSVYRLAKNLRYGIRGLSNGYKMITSVIVIIFCFYLLINSNVMLDPVKSFDFDTLNPLSIDLENWGDNTPSSNYYNDNSQSEEDIPSIEELRTGPKSVTLTYYLHGQEYSMDYTVYQGLNDYLASLPRTITYYTIPPTTKDFIMRDINQEQQNVFLSEFVESITNITDNKDDQARIAVSIVQQIPYDWSGLYFSFDSGEFPYEVLYTQSGVCGEKSNLLVYLLRELGFGVAAFEFENDNHRAVGLKCPMEYSYRGTGYCFVESARPLIITDSESDYIGVGKLTTHELITIADGSSFDSVSEEYYDAQEFNELNDKADASGGILNQYDYNRWWELVNKYGIEVG